MTLKISVSRHVRLIIMKFCTKAPNAAKDQTRLRAFDNDYLILKMFTKT